MSQAPTHRSRTPPDPTGTARSVLTARALRLTPGLVCSLALIVTVAPAHAAFPGANGKIAFTSTRDGNEEIYAMNPDGTDQTNLTGHPSEDSRPAWSSDGKRIAFASDRDGNEEIYVMNADGSGQTRLTGNAADDLGPAWSPDGRRIAFASNRDGNYEIYAMNADGTGQTRLTMNAMDEFDPAWSPDGQRIAFFSPYEMYAMNPDGSGQTRLTSNAHGPAWSPDGRGIVFGRFFQVSHAYGASEIVTMNVKGCGVRRLTSTPPLGGGYYEPAWSPDGERIAFSSVPEIHVMNADGSGRTTLTSSSGIDRHPDWQPLPGGTVSPSPPAKCHRILILSYHERRDRFKGTIHADVSACITEQKVTVYERKRGKDPKVGSDTTGPVLPAGYSVRERNAEGRFYARAKRKKTSAGTCLSAKSEKLRIR